MAVSQSEIKPTRWWNSVPMWVPLVITFLTFVSGLGGGYVASQVKSAHNQWVEDDHEKRISGVEAKLQILYEMNGRLSRIEGALGVKTPNQ